MSMKIKTKEDLRLRYRLQTGKSDEDNHSIEYLQWLEDRLVKNCSISSVRLSECCKAPVDHDNIDGQYCTNCLCSCEAHSA